MFMPSFLPSKLLTLSLIATLAATSAACSKNNALPGGAEPAGHVEEGGVNGGGGGTLPAQPIAAWQVRQVIQRAKLSLIPLLNTKSLELVRSSSLSNVDQKLFRGDRTILDVLHETNIDVMYTGACKDGNGKEVDGSIFGLTPDSICISAERIAAKLTEERALPEIVALIAHELSHKLGADEAEATEFQKDVAMSLSAPYLKASAEETVQASASASQALQVSISTLLRDIDSKTEAQLDNSLTNFKSAEMDFFIATRNYPFSILGLREEHYFDVQRTRVLVVSHYLAMATSAYAAEELRMAFRGKTELTFAEYGKNTKEIDPEKNVYANEVIKLPASLEEAKQILKQTYEFYSGVSEIAGHMRFGTRPNAVPLPDNKETPFKNFVGKYKVLSAVCSGGKPSSTVTEYEIYNGSSGTLRLRKVFNTMTGDQGELINGGSVVRSGSAVQVEGNEEFATRTVEFGNRWGSHQLTGFQKDTLTIKKVSSQFEVTESYYERAENYKTDLFDEVTKSCKYSLEKMP
ncbi:MAG: hypothetical protein EOP05_12350 [Proteobacteria bacterium]|nr:MAG: hypothetical protein EOP05_12350 [Pseudomonadota bacterium]